MRSLDLCCVERDLEQEKLLAGKLLARRLLGTKVEPNDYQLLWRVVPQLPDEYDFETSLAKFGMNEKIARSTPPGTFVVDMGSGRSVRLSQEQLQEKKLGLITTDINPSLLREDRPGVTAHVALDIQDLPEICETQLIPVALNTFVQGEKTPARVQKNISSLIEILTGKNIGSFVFSHVLKHLSPEAVERVLKMAILNVAPGGSIFIIDSCPQTHALHDSNGSIFNSAEKVTAMAPDEFEINDIILGTQFPELIAASIFRSLQSEAAPYTKTRDLVRALYGEGLYYVRELKVDKFLKDPQNNYLESGEGNLLCMELSNRIMTIRKKSI